MTPPTNDPGYTPLPPFFVPGGPVTPPPPTQPPTPPPAAPAPQAATPAPATPHPTVPPPPGMQPANPVRPPTHGQPTPADNPATKAATETSDWVIMAIGLVLPWCCLLYVGFIPSGIAALWAWIKIQEHKKANRQPPTLLTVTSWGSLAMVILSVISFVWFTAFNFLTSN